MTEKESYFQRIIPRYTGSQRPYWRTISLTILVIWLIYYLKKMALIG